MAHITYSNGAAEFGRGPRRLLHRGLAAVRQFIVVLQGEFAEQHRQYQFEKAFRHLDLRLLRDIGLERNAS